MRHAAQCLAVAAPLLAVGCGLLGQSAPAPQPRYVVGPAYQVNGVWLYPREDFRLDTTGLAVVLPDQAGLTANGERRDTAAIAGAHATLQLPAVARVTNLETGLQMLVRINDRGPASPARLIGLTRRAATRLGIAPTAVARVRLEIEDGPSQALRSLLQDAPGIAVARAPRDAVTSEPLALPVGIGQSSRVRFAAAASSASDAVAGPSGVPVPLSDTVSRVATNPGLLWLRAGEFGQARYADQVRARLQGVAASVERVRQGRADSFRVRAGPFADVGQADSALDQALRAGVTDARIVVE